MERFILVLVGILEAVSIFLLCMQLLATQKLKRPLYRSRIMMTEGHLSFLSQETSTEILQRLNASAAIRIPVERCAHHPLGQRIQLLWGYS